VSASASSLRVVDMTPLSMTVKINYPAVLRLVMDGSKISRLMVTAKIVFKVEH